MSVHRCCGLSLVTGPDRWGFWGTILLIVPPACIVAYFVLYPYWLLGHYAVLPIGILLTFLILVFFLAVSFTDPGVCPRGNEPMPSVLSRVTSQIPYSGRGVIEYYCTTCRIWRPLRTHHCSVCNSCIQRFDHHCVWIGNCVGTRNYRFFFAFITSIFIACTYFTILGCYLFMTEFTKYPGALFCSIYTIILALMMGSFMIQNIFFISKGITYYEHYKKIDVSVFKASAGENCYQSLCSQRSPSWVLSE
jgi:palmitoyltransferase ZDHHC9/14/18